MLAKVYTKSTIIRTTLFPMLLLQRKDRQEDEDTHDGHDQPTDGTCCQREPEPFLACAHHERNEAQDGRYHRQEYRDNLGIPCLDIGTHRLQAPIATAHGIVFVQDVDACVHRNTAKQHERGKASLVEVQTEQVERKEYPDVRNRYHEDDGQRLLERVEQDTGGNEDDTDDNEQQGVLLVVLLAPRPALLLVFGHIAHGQYGIEFFQVLLQELASLLVRTDVLVLQAEAVLLVLLGHLLRL